VEKAQIPLHTSTKRLLAMFSHASWWQWFRQNCYGNLNPLTWKLSYSSQNTFYHFAQPPKARRGSSQNLLPMTMKGIFHPPHHATLHINIIFFPLSQSIRSNTYLSLLFPLYAEKRITTMYQRSVSVSVIIKKVYIKGYMCEVFKIRIKYLFRPRFCSVCCGWSSFWQNV